MTESYRYLILWYGPWDGDTSEVARGEEAIAVLQGGDATPRFWREVTMRVHEHPSSELRENVGPSWLPPYSSDVRYMVVPLDEARQPEEFILRASYTAEPA